MFSELLERTAAQRSNELPFVIYRKPDESAVNAIFQKDAQLHYIEDYSEKGFVFAPFDSNNPAILLKDDESFEANGPTIKTNVLDNSDSQGSDGAHKAFHINLVQKGIEKIKEGSLKKVVLSRQFQIHVEDPPLELFQKLLSRYTSAFCYLWYHPRVGMWLGATPEILLHVENKRFRTMSLAGTQPYRSGQDPVWKQKEIEEQAMVTQYILDALGDKISEIKVKEAESVRAGNLWHLRSQIMGDLSSPLSEIISALHPTPAVCGLPLMDARQFIHENEGYPREYYAGFLGELHIKKNQERSLSRKNTENKAYRSVKTITDLYVNLRCMQILGHKARIYVGGGITKGSVPEDEWQETVYKSGTMLSVLGQK